MIQICLDMVDMHVCVIIATYMFISHGVIILKYVRFMQTINDESNWKMANRVQLNIYSYGNNFKNESKQSPAFKTK